MKRPSRLRKWLVYIVAFIVLSAGLGYVLDFFPEEEKELRREVRKAIESTFPEQAAEVAKSFGLVSFSGEVTGSVAVTAEALSVVLIHGMDDPGLVWMNLAPALTDEHLNVWKMYYPNDQPIVDSASLFQDELARLKQSGISEITIVAHSMGGLVSREMLTNPQFSYIENAQHDELPRVTALVMVGTPNHGSEWARYRFFAEIRDQWINVVENGAPILRGFMDGAGEAQIDLRPDSQFLTALNSRPHPEGVRLLTISGIVSPWEDNEINDFLYSSFEEGTANEAAALIKSMSDGLGDGLVTVDSSRLQGVEYRTVLGTHLTMIRNLTTESTHIPPSIPIIIEFLRQVPDSSHP